jgi:hypothetical protein
MRPIPLRASQSSHLLKKECRRRMFGARRGDLGVGYVAHRQECLCYLGVAEADSARALWRKAMVRSQACLAAAGLWTSGRCSFMKAWSAS